MSQKKARVFSRDFKLRAVERMLAGEGASELARELDVRRKLLYEWKDAFLTGGVASLRTRGRPRKDEARGDPPLGGTGRAELLLARKRIAELERKVGKQQLEVDFFVEALRRVDAALAEQGAERSMRSSKIKRGKAD